MGPLAEEAALLVDVLGQRVESARAGLRLLVSTPEPGNDSPADPPASGAVGGAADRGAEVPPRWAEDPHPSGSVPCTSCPWCRVRAAVRDQGPELSLGLLDAAGTLLDTVRRLLPAAGGSGRTAQPDGADGPEGADGPDGAEGADGPGREVPGPTAGVSPGSAAADRAAARTSARTSGADAGADARPRVQRIEVR
ncbi:hypothetical protein [Nakamurella endophytica]|uniref:hypothetical protein n=1 Tax=Nakamurella endophytica TaxID=1748367 RepID=UPI001666F4BA|nr:hypothetical protein [Nakamurella endophytica]